MLFSYCNYNKMIEYLSIIAFTWPYELISASTANWLVID
jgi:hypothetical protein